MAVVKKNQTKIHRWVAYYLLSKIVRKLQPNKYVMAGSYRRGKWWLNDLDLLIEVASDSEAEGYVHRIQQFGWLPVEGRGRYNLTTFSKQFYKDLSGHIVILDLFLIEPGAWGNALLFTTGSKYFNNRLRSKAISLGYSWNNPRYFERLVDGVQISFDTEHKALAFLGERWIRPRVRL